VTGSKAKKPTPETQERERVIALIVAVIVCTTIPYLMGYATASSFPPPGAQFIGSVYNIDDYCNYLSWLRQTMDGHFFLHNLFTTEPQKGLECNALFWILGRAAVLAHLSSQAILQAARILGGAGLLAAVYGLYRYCLPSDRTARLSAFAFACFGSGFGWMVWQRWQDKNPGHGCPVDAFQPEAFTFLSIYASALFAVSTLFIVGALFALLKAESTRRARWAVAGGLCAAVLGNIHSYDVLHIAAAWGLFLVVETVRARGRGMAGAWGRAALALAVALPTVLYQYYVFHAEAVFHERAEVKTTTPAIWYYAAGYGVVFLLAVLALCLLAAKRATPKSRSAGDSDTAGPPAAIAAGRNIRFIVCWAVAGLAIAYLPVAFQRKMIMGEDIPLCLLAGIGAAFVARLAPVRLRATVVTALVLLSMPSNAFFIRRDLVHLSENRSETSSQPFIGNDLLQTYQWIEVNTPPKAAVAGFPPLCLYLPARTGRAVWAGHWGETPDYGSKIGQFVDAMNSTTTDSDRQAFLTSTAAQYLLYLNHPPPFPAAHHKSIVLADLAAHPPAYLVPVFSNANYTVFRIDGN
jgi:hypothetical protein